MIKNYKNRTIDYTKPVRVYRNLHNKCYSIQQNGIVVAHADEINLKICKFIINKAGQARVRREKTKNVHAFIEGYVAGRIHNTKQRKNKWKRVYYTPYQFDTFVKINSINDFEEINESKYVKICQNVVIALTK